jgi:hypothetical protein
MNDYVYIPELFAIERDEYHRKARALYEKVAKEGSHQPSKPFRSWFSQSSDSLRPRTFGLNGGQQA